MDEAKLLYPYINNIPLFFFFYLLLVAPFYYQPEVTSFPLPFEKQSSKIQQEFKVLTES